MKFGIKNLGPIKEANIELGDLTIICGKNNRGKTYLTYSLYSFLDTMRENLVLDIEDQYFNDCCRNGSTMLDVKKIWAEYNSALIKPLEKFSERIPFFLALSQKQNNQSIFASMDEKDLDIFIGKGIKAKFQVTEKCAFIIEKKQDASVLKITLENTGERLPKKSNLKNMFQMACSLFINDIIPDTFSLTSERTGVAIFTDELATIVASNLHRSGRNRVQRIDESEERKSAPYPLPVMKEIAFFLKIKKIAKNTSFICDKHPEILEEFSNIVDGKYIVDEYKGIQYIQKDTGRKLFLSECSSSVKSLVELYFYLQCCARPNQVLMVDEPELTLHPENLRKLARLFVHLTNIGIRVLITTHSDYIIREFNMMIQLKQDKPYVKKIREVEGYSEFHLLTANNVRAYISEKQDNDIIFKEVKISPNKGMAISTLDDVINAMNSIQDAILWGE